MPQRVAHKGLAVTSRRLAYTLFELVIVAAVIVISAALAMPSIENMYGPYRLNAAVDAVRAAWALGRSHAIEEGRPYRFAVTPGSANYRLAPDDESSSSRAFVLQDRLPKDVVFAVPQQSGDDGQSSDGLSTVAVFLPDGTARDDAVLSFQVKGVQPKTIRLRALTGAVTVQPQSGGGTR